MALAIQCFSLAIPALVQSYNVLAQSHKLPTHSQNLTKQEQEQILKDNADMQISYLQKPIQMSLFKGSSEQSCLGLGRGCVSCVDLCELLPVALVVATSVSFVTL